ncbi:MAG: DUF4294 domain-containing protein [Bacteroidales bacterium]|nr:DUF4294 domain-containing protein [Bacteroidales bacterium]
MQKAVLIISFLFLFVVLSAQQTTPIISQAIIIDGDTVPQINLAAIYIVGHKKFATKKAERRYYRLVRYVKNVYPYAKLAGEKLRDYDQILRATDSKRERRKIMKRVEKEIRADYEGKLRKLYVGEGKILVKLIDRECNHSSYVLLKELRGGVSATLWQGVGRLFGYNLKVRYDPKGKDRNIEMIVRMIERGII